MHAAQQSEFEPYIRQLIGGRPARDHATMDPSFGLWCLGCRVFAREAGGRYCSCCEWNRAYAMQRSSPRLP